MIQATGHDQVWRALADERRREILDLLAERPRTTGEVCEAVGGLCRTAVLRHLEVLTTAGLVAVRRQGRVRWNEFDPAPLRRAVEPWLERRRRGWEGSFARLKELAETGEIGGERELERDTK
jgi:DNA-binding transcriptional ArsR family regulator